MITAKEKIKEVLDKEYVSSTEEKKEQVAAKLVEALGLNNAKYMTEEDMKSGGSFNPKETCDSRMKKVARENINLLEERLKLCSRHGLIIANPGEGKHFVAKKEIETILKNTMDDVFVIDQQHDFGQDLGYVYNQRIHLDPNSSSCINPLDIDLQDIDEDEWDRTLCGITDMLSEISEKFGHSVDANEAYLLDKAVTKAYEEAKKSGKSPYLSDILYLLPPESELYCVLYPLSQYDCFNKQTNVRYTSRMTIFDFGQFNEQLTLAGAYFVIAQIGHILKERVKQGKRTWLFITDFELLVGEKRSNFIEHFYRTCRKHGCACTMLISKGSNNNPYYCEESLRVFLMNSEYIIIPNIDAIDNGFFEILHIDDDDLRYNAGFRKIVYIIGERYVVTTHIE